jgi:hypothetical protein
MSLNPSIKKKETNKKKRKEIIVIGGKWGCNFRHVA